MNIDTTITIDALLNTGLALLGWLYIMSRTWRWLGSIFLKQWKKTAQTGTTPEGIRSVL